MPLTRVTPKSLAQKFVRFPSRIGRALAEHRLFTYFAVLGPGIIAASSGNEASGIATYSVAGAEYGYSLLWSFIPMTICVIIAQEMCVRMGVVTGQGLADLIREQFGVRWTALVMFALLIANSGIIAAQFVGIAQASELLGARGDDVVDKLRQLLDRQKKLEREIESFKAKEAVGATASLVDSALDLGGFKLVAARLEGLDGKALRDAVDTLKSRMDNAVIVLASATDGKAALVAGVKGSALGKVKAGDLLAHVAAQIGGKGGGRPDMAQGGGNDGPELVAALSGLREWVTERLN